MYRLALTFVIATLSAIGADISGTWQMDVQTDQGSGNPTFVLKQQDDKLTGTYSGLLGEAKVAGSVKGEDVLIEFEADAGEGRVTVRYTGKLEGDSRMKGKVTLGPIGGTFTGKKK